MDEQNLAANTAPAEGVATQTTDITPDISTNAQDGQQPDVNQQAPQQPETRIEDVTQTQAFARRLKEEVERASQRRHSKLEILGYPNRVTNGKVNVFPVRQSINKL